MSTQTSRGDVLDSAISPDGRYLAYLAGRRRATSACACDRSRPAATWRCCPRGTPPSRARPSPRTGTTSSTSTRKPDTPNYRSLLQVPSLGGTPQERVFDVDSRVSLLARREAGSPSGGACPRSRNRGSSCSTSRARRSACWPRSRSPRSYQGPPSWSPDGTTIAASLLKPAPDLQTTVAFFDAETGSRRDYLALPRTVFASLAWLPDGRGLVATGQDLKGALLRPGVPDRPSRPAAAAGHQRLQHLRRGLGVLGRRGHRRGPPHPARQPLARRRDGRARPADHVDHEPGGLEHRLRGGGPGDRGLHAPRDQSLQVWATGTAGGEPRALTSGTMHSFNRGRPAA